MFGRTSSREGTVLSRLRNRRFGVALVGAVLVALSIGVAPAVAGTSPAAVGALAGSVTFSQNCSSGIGVGITFDGTNLWYSCYASSPDLLRADPLTGKVTASYNISGGLGALSYDAKHNVIWAGWGDWYGDGNIKSISLDGSKNVTGSAIAFNTCPSQCGQDIDDGLAYDGSTGNLLVSQDGSQTISTFTSTGALISSVNWAGGSNCYNSGVALGDQLIFEGADGCSHVYVVNKNDPSKILFDFPTAVSGDPNFRDEGLTCDTTTFAAQGEQVMWSKEAYSPMRAHAFVIPDGTCGQGGQPAPGGSTPPSFSGPLPLLVAHGISNTAADESAIQATATQVVPGLGARALNTGATSSVWANASEIDTEAAQVIQQTGAPGVNIVAHSKGGLDSRAAIWQDPSLFKQLGMLATPNGGSNEANFLCQVRRLPVVGGVASNFGACNTQADGLYDLQTWYVQKEFNDIVRDGAEFPYYVLGSNCSTSPTTMVCNGTANGLLHCPNGGDMLVCLNSAYWLTNTWPNVPGGEQLGLPPLSGYTHDQMNTDFCPITDVLAALYPLDSQGNPWIDSLGTSCTPPARANLAVNAAQVPQTASTAPAAWADQSVISGSSDPAHPFTVTLNPEGGDAMQATVLIPSGVTPTFTVTDSSGSTDQSAVVSLNPNGDGLGAQSASVSLSGLGGATRTLTVALDQSSAIGLQTQVSSPVSLDVSAAASSSGGNAVVSATLSLDAGAAKAVSIVATYVGANGQQVSTPLVYKATSGGISTFTASIAAQTGNPTPIDVTATGKGFARTASTGIVLADGSGQIGHVHADTLADPTNSGHLDTLSLPVQVTVARAGSYHLSVDLAASGTTVGSGSGDATLQAGTSDINVSVPVSRLLASRAPAGSFEIVNGTLSEGTSGRIIIAHAADMGASGSYDLSAYTPAATTVSRLTSTNVDANNDGLFDVLRVNGAVSAPSAGKYQLSGTLYGPSGTPVTQVNQTETLTAGRNTLKIDLDGNLVGSTGSGLYQLRGFTLTPMSDPTTHATAAILFIRPLDSTDWIGAAPNAPTLSRLWDKAQHDSAIHRYGLYVSEHNRLSRVVAAATSGDIATEKSNLDAFISDVTGAGATIDSPSENALVSYANALRATLGT